MAIFDLKRQFFGSWFGKHHFHVLAIRQIFLPFQVSNQIFFMQMKEEHHCWTIHLHIFICSKLCMMCILFVYVSWSSFGKPLILALGDCIPVRPWSDSPITCLAELRMVWRDKNESSILTGLRLYFLPENTPIGRNCHGEVSIYFVLFTFNFCKYRRNCIYSCAQTS